MTDAAQLHRDAIVVDSLGPDGPTVYSDAMLQRLDQLAATGTPPAIAIDELARLRDEALLRTELPEFWRRWEASGVDVTSYTVGAFGDEPFTYANAIRDLARWLRKFEEIPRYVKVTSADDASRAHAEGKQGVILNLQNTEHFRDDLGLLREFYDLGVRIVQLTYNGSNLVGDGCLASDPSGLTDYGREVVRSMNDLGVLIDVSHCSHPTAMDAVKESDRPIAITHGFAHSLSPHDRGACDELIRAVGERGGYVGVVCVPFFLSSDTEVTLDHFLRHVDHIAALIGIEKVGVGTDWDPPLPPTLQRMLTEEVERLGFRPEHRVDWSATIAELQAWEDWPNITSALLAHGYSAEEVRGVLGANFLRVFREAAG